MQQEGGKGGCEWGMPMLLCAAVLVLRTKGGLVGIWEGRGVIVLEGVEDAVDLCTQQAARRGHKAQQRYVRERVKGMARVTDLLSI